MSSSINNWQNNESNANKESVEEDALDAFMSSLSSFALTKSDIAKMKLELLNLRKEEASLIKLLNLTRPANLPPLLSYDTNTDQAIRKIKTETERETKTNEIQSTVSKISKIQDSVSRSRRVSLFLNFGLLLLFAKLHFYHNFYYISYRKNKQLAEQ